MIDLEKITITELHRRIGNTASPSPSAHKSPRGWALPGNYGLHCARHLSAGAGTALKPLAFSSAEAGRLDH